MPPGCRQRESMGGPFHALHAKAHELQGDGGRGGLLRRWVVSNEHKRAFPFELLHQLLQVVGCPNVEVRNERSLSRIGRGHDEGPCPLLHGQISEGDHPTTGPQAAVQSQFTSAPEAVELGAIKLSAGHQQPQRDGEIKGRPFLASVGWRKVDHHPHQWTAEATVP